MHLRERGLARLADAAILRLAADEARIGITFGLDFSRILAIHRLPYPSVVLFRLEGFTTDEINLLLTDLLTRYANDLSAGAIVVIDPAHIRVRRLPIF
ncbi:MAG: DUF5615 family PIN-like protein [Pirellulales bacterium]|nr:DUF5615 family PIN-like protein [Pirellulales bacterium]